MEEVIQKLRKRFGPKRKDGARKWRSGGRCAVECEGFEEQPCEDVVRRMVDS
jgi:hypothetical protein